jgi:ribosome-associated translation inhibitor RaiA
LIKTQELKPNLSLKTSKTKTNEKIEQMLKELDKVKTEKGESSKINVLHKNDEVTVETCSSSLETASDEKIDKLEKAFGKLQRITNKKLNPTNFTKNWYPRPTPSDMQFEERNF